MKEAEKNGIILKKEWIAVNGSRTRDWHAELNGVAIDIDEKFENEYGEIEYPGDTSAEPGNYYNCRCSLGTKIIGFR